MRAQKRLVGPRPHRNDQRMGKNRVGQAVWPDIRPARLLGIHQLNALEIAVVFGVLDVFPEDQRVHAVFAHVADAVAVVIYQVFEPLGLSSGMPSPVQSVVLMMPSGTPVPCRSMACQQGTV